VGRTTRAEGRAKRPWGAGAGAGAVFEKGPRSGSDALRRHEHRTNATRLFNCSVDDIATALK